MYANALCKNSLSISFCPSTVYLLYLPLSHLSDAMGGRCCALPPNPPSFLKHHIFHTCLSNSLSLFVFVHHLTNPFFIPIYAKLYLLSTYSFVMFCLSISTTLVCATRFLIYPIPTGGGAAPSSQPPQLFEASYFSHMSIQFPLSFCLCPSPHQPFFHTHICKTISLVHL